MRRTIYLGAAAMAASALLAACGSDDDDGTGAGGSSPSASTSPAAHTHTPSNETLTITPALAADLQAMRMGTARYATDLDAALADGYFMITQMIPDMGYHFLNPGVEGFDPAKPPILVYGRDGDAWELVAYEWVFPEEPAEPPMDGATYGSFPAACHYEDGLFVQAAAEDECAATHPESGAAFTFWHPDLVTFHVWTRMHNPDGLYNGTNPLMSSYNGG